MLARGEPLVSPASLPCKPLRDPGGDSGLDDVQADVVSLKLELEDLMQGSRLDCADHPLLASVAVLLIHCRVATAASNTHLFVVAQALALSITKKC